MNSLFEAWIIWKLPERAGTQSFENWVDEQLFDTLVNSKIKIDLHSSIDGLSALEGISFALKNFSLKHPDEFLKKYGIQKISFSNKVLYANAMDFGNIQYCDLQNFIHYLGSLTPEEQNEVFNNVYAAINGMTYIAMYNHDYTSELQGLAQGKDLAACELEYFEGIPRENIPDLYKKSTLSHELAHSEFPKILEKSERFGERETIIKNYGSLSKYAEMYNGKDFVLYLNENFAEAVRIYTVNPRYLKQHFPLAFDFIKEKFSHIRSICEFEK